MPSDWNLSPFHKEGPIICTNLRGISFLNISYKVLSSVICEGLNSIIDRLIGPYQCDFRTGILRQILKKQRVRSHLYEFRISDKLVRFCKMTLSSNSCTVHIEKNFTTSFNTKPVFFDWVTLYCVISST